MIAKAATISHGSNAIRYSVNKDRADIVKTNLLPDDISPEAMFKRMCCGRGKGSWICERRYDRVFTGAGWKFLFYGNEYKNTSGTSYY